MSVPMSSSNLPRLLRRAEASRYLARRYKLKRSVGTLGAYASAGTGPVYRKISGVCFYAIDDLDRYASELVTAAARKAPSTAGRQPRSANARSSGSRRIQTSRRGALRQRHQGRCRRHQQTPYRTKAETLQHRSRAGAPVRPVTALAHQAPLNDDAGASTRERRRLQVL
jgi:hypothetical protein